MNPEIKKIWLDALRSGEYKQGDGVLAKTVEWDEKPRYCCLGVLCDIAAKQGVPIEITPPKDEVFNEWEFDNETESLPESVREWAGIEDSLGGFPNASENSMDTWYTHGGRHFINLADMNDKGVTFEELADVIEKEF